MMDILIIFLITHRLNKMNLKELTERLSCLDIDKIEGEIKSDPISVFKDSVRYLETSCYIKVLGIDEMVSGIDFDDVPDEYKQFNELKK